MDARQEITAPFPGLLQEEYLGTRMTERTAKDLRPSEEPHLSEYDKEIADSFPASDPPAQP